MEKVTLKKLTKYTTDKEGKPLVSVKTGKAYTRLVIETEEHPKPLSGFENAETSRWAVGQEVEVEVKENGQYLNFSLPNKEDRVSEQLEIILNKLTGLQLSIGVLTDHLIPKKKAPIDYPEMEDEPAF